MFDKRILAMHICIVWQAHRKSLSGTPGGLSLCVDGASSEAGVRFDAAV